ncbi:23698_t:CDS:2, partial [Gigaspora margarita]
VMLWCTTADRQERDREGEKAQENIKKKAQSASLNRPKTCKILVTHSSNRCGNTIKYPFIATMREKVLGMQEQVMLWCTTTDRQKRSREVKKVQKDTQKKGYERWDCTSGPPIQHFVPQPGNQK